MPLLKNIPTIQVDLPAAGEWVVLKTALTAGDEISIRAAAAAGMHMDLDDVASLTPDFEASILAAEFRVAELMLTAWSFEEAVTPENIRTLDPPSWKCVKDSIEKLTSGDVRSDDERKN